METLELMAFSWRAAATDLGKSLARVVLVEESLALQVGRLHEIAIDDAKVADACASQKTSGGRANGSAATITRSKRVNALASHQGDQKVSVASIFPEEIWHEWAARAGFNRSPRSDDTAQTNGTGNAAVLRFVRDY